MEKNMENTVLSMVWGLGFTWRSMGTCNAIIGFRV